MREAFWERLSRPGPLILDGATGTELTRRGVNLTSASWSAQALIDAPEVLLRIHQDYVNAGAEVITTNTFRTHARSLEAIGRAGDARELTRHAVEIAREAAGEAAYVAGSISPLEDCYSPQLTPDLQSLREEHSALARDLADAGVDLLLIETQLTVREALAAAEAASETGLPFCVSFVCRRPGELLSGESIQDAARAIVPLQPAALMVNCIPVSEVLESLLLIRQVAPDLPLGACANTGRLLANGSWEATDGESPAVYAEFAKAWSESEIQLIGGCCGTTPEHISALSKRL